MASVDTASEDVDVVIIGAGISGIGAAYHLHKHCPDKRYVILERRAAIGGTWDLFRYPGIRSDSDMFTLGYHFKPWTEPKAIADGASIKRYVEEAAAEHDVKRHIRYRHRGISADWSSEDARWTVEAVHEDTGERVTLRCSFLMHCSGYYDYDAGYTPEFPGRERFEGTIVHPQQWPEDLDYQGKKVVVIGSGATAVTLIPAMASTASHVTMLQRSPTYMAVAPDRDWMADVLRKLLPARLAYRLIRWRNALLQGFFYRQVRKRPQMAKRRLLDIVRKELPAGSDLERDFTPSYDPWDQRLCLVPNGDLFQAMRDGKASVVTAQIESFTESGIQLSTGEALDAHVIVTATGLNLLLMGGMRMSLDGDPIDFAKTFTYKGMMCSGVPNMTWTFGYINASWTLRADLNAEYACRLINHMDATGTRSCTPELGPDEQQMEARPWLTEFTPGYLQRVIHLFPRQGDHEPWVNSQDYARDKKMLRKAPIEDGALKFR